MSLYTWVYLLLEPIDREPTKQRGQRLEKVGNRQMKVIEKKV